jgi:hypothetical protein
VSSSLSVLCASAFHFIGLSLTRNRWKPVFHHRQDACFPCQS